MAQLTREHILKLARLSRLELKDDEIEQYLKELQAILEYVERLEAVDVTGIEPTYQVSGLRNTPKTMRIDEVQEQLASPAELLKGVPRTKDGYIQVGRMI
jgi:aspartyl-tRNA(Asn)/glutamyl-tRNA(Gln) amidotransferase subunit C